MALTKVSRGLLSTGIVDNSNGTAITIDGSENVGVGVAPIGTGLNIKANGSGYIDGALSLTDSDSNTRTYITHVNDIFAVSMNDGAADGILMSGAGAVTVANGLTLADGNLVVAAGHGIDFSATSESVTAGTTHTSSLFEDYEEGYWQPTLLGTTGTITDGAVGLGSYTKIGNLIHLTWYVVAGGLNGATGSLHIGNLPYIALSGGTTNSRITTGSCMTHNLTITAGRTWVVPYVPHAGDEIHFYGSGTGAPWAAQSVDGDFNMIGAISYRTV